MKQYGKRNAMDVVIWLKNYDNLFTATCSLCQSQLCGFPHRSYLGATAERTLSSFQPVVISTLELPSILHAAMASCCCECNIVVLAVC